jgi:hypothetical protein
MSAVGYYLAYRSIYASEGGCELSRRQLTAMVATGFGGLFSTGGIRPDGLVLQAGGVSRREAMVRVTTLTGMEQGMLALDRYAASIAWLCLGLAGVPVDLTLPRWDHGRRLVRPEVAAITVSRCHHGSGDLRSWVSWRTSSRSRPSASISASTP